MVKNGRSIPSEWAVSPQPAHNLSPRGVHPPIPPNSPNSAEMVHAGPLQTYVLHAPGAKMTVVYTNSLKSLLSFVQGLGSE